MVTLKVGSNLWLGRRYRILEIDPSDPDPSLKVGDMVLCAAQTKGCIDPENHEGDGLETQWFADYDEAEGVYRTLVTRVEFVPE